MFLHIIILAIFTVAYMVGSIKDKNASNIRNIISSILVFWASPLLLANIFSWTGRISVIKELPKVVQLTIRILVFVVVLIVGIMISVPVEIVK